MKKQRLLSIERTSRFLFRFTILLLAVNILAFLLIGWSSIVTARLDRDSGEFFKVVNRYALRVNEGPAKVTAETDALYERLTEYAEGICSRLTRNTHLPPPEFNTAEQKERYAQAIRDYASTVRANLSSTTRSSYAHITALLILSLVTTILLVVQMLRWRRNQKSFSRQMLSGFDRLDRVLKYRDSKPSAEEKYRIAEIEEFKSIIERIETDIFFDRRLLESEVQGDLYSVLQGLHDQLAKVMPCDRIALAFIDSTGNVTAETAYAEYNRIVLEPGFTEPLANTHLREVIDSRRPRIINDLEDHAARESVSESTRMILAEGIKASLTLPMCFDEKCMGFLFISSLQKNVYNDDAANYANRLVNLVKQRLYIEFLLQEVVSGTSNSFVTLMHEKDNETSNHIVRMSRYSHIIARTYHDTVREISPRIIREILLFAPLHDIGKVGIPDSILLKEGPLDADQWRIMKTHVDIGRRILDDMNANLQKLVNFPILATAVDLIAGHHEKFDGSGYPEGLKGKDISLAGRIVAAADVFDALTSRRPYKKAFSIEEALRIMREEMTGHFDPEVLECLVRGLPEIEKVYERLKEV